MSVEPVDPAPLFSPASTVTILALPPETVDVRHPEVDTGVPSQLARIAAEHPDKRAVVVEGRYSHVSFLLDPDPIRVHVRGRAPSPRQVARPGAAVLDLADALPPVLLGPS